LNSIYLSRIKTSISTLNKNIETTTNQVSSGRTFQKGSENIEAFNIHLKIKQDLKEFNTVKNDLSYAKNILNSSEASINTIENLNDTIYTDLLKMSNYGNYSDKERDIFVNELKTIKDEMINIANTQVNGQYIFSGTFTERKPFDIDNVKRNGDTLLEEMVYNGNEDSKEVYVDKNYKKDFSITGKDLFMDTKLFETIDEVIRIFENRTLEVSKELNNLEKTQNQDISHKMISKINDNLQNLDFTQLTSNQKINIGEYTNNIEKYIKEPSMDNYNMVTQQLNILKTGNMAEPGPHQHQNELTAMFDIAEYNVSLNTFNNRQVVIDTVNINQPVKTYTDINGAATYTFELGTQENINNVKLDLNLYDAEGGFRVAINGVEILAPTPQSGANNNISTITFSDAKGEYLKEGSNTIQIWSTNGDAGNINDVKVYTDSIEDIFEQKDALLSKYDTLFTDEHKEDIVYQYNMTMYKLDLKEYSENPTPEGLEKMELSKKYLNNTATQVEIDTWKADQKYKYEGIVAKNISYLNVNVNTINGSNDITKIADFGTLVQEFLKDPSLDNFDKVRLIKDDLLNDTVTTSPELGNNITNEIENIFDYVEYINQSSNWSDNHVSDDMIYINDYMFNLSKNPFTTKLEDMKDVQDSIARVKGKLGNTYKYIENSELKISNKTLELRKFYIDNVDADMSEVAMKLTQETNSLNALYSVVAKLQSLSLTNFLK